MGKLSSTVMALGLKPAFINNASRMISSPQSIEMKPSAKSPISTPKKPKNALSRLI